VRVHRQFILSSLALAALLPVGAAHATGVSGQGTWETTLLPRDINGDGAVDAFYDTVLDVSWLADGAVIGVTTGGEASAWAANLDVHGITGWRLPTMIDTGAPGCDHSFAGGTDCGFNPQTISQDGQTVFSEMAHLGFVSLGNKAYCLPGDSECMAPQPDWGLTNTGGFRNLYGTAYWLGLAFEPYPVDMVWTFDTQYGYQNGFPQEWEGLSIAVHAGDVAAVPEPQTSALLLLGVAGVLATVRRPSV